MSVPGVPTLELRGVSKSFGVKEFTIGENNTVLLGEPYRFNKDNIDNFDF